MSHPPFDPRLYSAERGGLDVEDLGDSIIVVVQVVLHNEEDDGENLSSVFCHIRSLFRLNFVKNSFEYTTNCLSLKKKIVLFVLNSKTFRTFATQISTYAKKNPYFTNCFCRQGGI